MTYSRCVFLISFICFWGGITPTFAQAGLPYCLHDSLGTYYLAHVDLTTGSLTDIGAVPGVNFWVLGNKYCISAHDSTYTFVGHDGSNSSLYTIKLSDASILFNPIFNGVKVGLRYNCGDSSIYAIEEKIGGYEFVKVDRVTGTTDSVGFFSGVSAYVGDAFALDGKGGNYHFMGLISSSIHLITINIYSGVTTFSPVFLDNPIGFSYSCKDSNIYAMWEDSIDYKLERIDPISGTHSTIGIVPGLDPGFVSESASVSFTGEYSFRGFFGSSQVIATVDVTTAALISTPHFSATASGLEQLVCCMPSNPIITELEEDEISLQSIFPNPFLDKFNCEFGRNVKNATLQLLDPSGRVMLEKRSINGASIQLSSTELSAGLYLLQVTEQGELVYSSRLLKE